MLLALLPELLPELLLPPALLPLVQLPPALLLPLEHRLPSPP